MQPCQVPSTSLKILDAHNNFLLAARELYATNVKWTAPTRNVQHVGREAVIQHLLREASGMYDPEFTFLRRSSNDRQIIDEFAVRFIYVGDGIENAPVDAGDFVDRKSVV